MVWDGMSVKARNMGLELIFTGHTVCKRSELLCTSTMGEQSEFFYESQHFGRLLIILTLMLFLIDKP